MITATYRSGSRPVRRSVLCSFTLSTIPKPSAGMPRVGEKVVYPGYGVTEVLRIERRAIAGRDCAFCVLQVLGGDATIMVPMANMTSVGVRPVMPRERARGVYRELRKPAVTPSGPWNRRHRDYQERIKIGSPESVASVVRDLLRVQNDKQLSFSERKMLETARALLVAELALALHRPEPAIEREIARICSA